jgi:NAD+ kinase
VIRRVGIVAHPNPEVSAGHRERLVRALESRGVRVDLEDPAGSEDGFGADLIFVLGGDGTMLRASRMYPNRILLGVNLGRVGFMSGMRPDQIEESVERILRGELNVQDYRMLEVRTADGESRLAVNDALLVKERPHRLISVEVSVNGEGFGSYMCDGFVAATTLGSTAYSLSAGGPIISRNAECYVLVSIAPHTLMSRPLVLGQGDEVDLRILDNKSALLSLDGDEPRVVAPGESVNVRLSGKKVRIARVDGWSWWQAVRRTFLGVGGDKG